MPHRPAILVSLQELVTLLLGDNPGQEGPAPQFLTTHSPESSAIRILIGEVIKQLGEPTASYR